MVFFNEKKKYSKNIQSLCRYTQYHTPIRKKSNKSIQVPSVGYVGLHTIVILMKDLKIQPKFITIKVSSIYWLEMGKVSLSTVNIQNVVVPPKFYEGH